MGHEELWGDDVPVDLQPQYYYNTTARCIYCYKYLCNQRHANKVKGESAGGAKRSTGGTKKRAASRTKRGRRDEDDDDFGDSDDRSARGRKASMGKARDTRLGFPTPPVQQNPLQSGESAYRAWLEGPRVLQAWQDHRFAVLDADAVDGKPLELRFNDGQGATAVAPGQCVLHGGASLFINATQSLPCAGVAWLSSDVLVIGGGASLQVWAGLAELQAPKLLYTLLLEAGPLTSFCALPRSGMTGVRHGAVAAVHADGRMRIHSLPVTGDDQGTLVLKQTGPSPASGLGVSAVVSVAVCTNSQHANRIILGHADGSLRWIDLPENPTADLPPVQGAGGAGFSIATAGYLPTSDAAFWAVGDSSSVAIGDIREPFGGTPAQPSSASDSAKQGEFNLRTADSSFAFPALVAGGDGGHVWALPWANDSATPPPRLLCSLNGAALAIRCHLFLPLSMTGCASGTARALWLPHSPVNQQLIVHAASAEDRFINIDAPFDLLDSGFRTAGTLACTSCAWAPDMEGRYAVSHAGGLVRVGNVREFIVRSTQLK